MKKKLQPIIARLLYYPSLGWNIFLGRALKIRKWWSVVDDNVILGAVPFSGDVILLKRMGVEAVLNLCEECYQPVSLYRQLDIDYMRLPVIDFISPDFETVLKGVSFIEDNVAHNKKVYVHCKAGRGRSATVVLCWLIKTMKLPPENAMDYLISKRPFVNNMIYRRKVVKEFYEKYVRGIRP